MNRRTILIVDDDANLRQTLRELVESVGYRTETASNAEEAVRLVQREPPTLILCDWKMPTAGGEYLLGRSPDKQIPIIIMTAHGTGPNALKAMELGAYDFITKPLDADTVLAMTDRAIRTRTSKGKSKSFARKPLKRPCQVTRHRLRSSSSLEHPLRG